MTTWCPHGNASRGRCRATSGRVRCVRGRSRATPGRVRRVPRSLQVDPGTRSATHGASVWPCPRVWITGLLETLRRRPASPDPATSAGRAPSQRALRVGGVRAEHAARVARPAVRARTAVRAVRASSPGRNRTYVACPDSKSGGPCQQTNRGLPQPCAAPGSLVSRARSDLSSGPSDHTTCHWSPIPRAVARAAVPVGPNPGCRVEVAPSPFGHFFWSPDGAPAGPRRSELLVSRCCATVLNQHGANRDIRIVSGRTRSSRLGVPILRNDG